MNGYEGNPDLEAERAILMAEKAIVASRRMLEGRVLTVCADCGEDIDPARVEAAIKNKRKCEYCIECQPYHDTAPKPSYSDFIMP